VAETGQAQGARVALIRLHPRDNVAVAGADIPPGMLVQVDDLALRARQAIPGGHKIALADIPAGGAVLKYGEVIGRASQAIQAGEHVHLHNLQSIRDSPAAEEEEIT
jgi:altronate dehydratase